MNWKRGLYRVWLVFSLFWIIIVFVVMIDDINERLHGNLAILIPNIGSPPEKPRSLAAKDEYVTSRLADYLNLPSTELEDTSLSDLNARASIALDTEFPQGETSETEDWLLSTVGANFVLKRRINKIRRSKLTQEQRDLEDQYISENTLWEDRSEFYDYFPRFAVGMLLLAFLVPLSVLGIYFILVWIARGFTSTKE